MAQIVKRISDPYLITSSNASVPTTVTIGSAIPDSASVTINGNLTVTGTQTIINTNNMSVQDKFITLNDNESGSGVSGAGTSGLIIDRGLSPNVVIQWNESVLKWQISDQTGSSFGNIAVTSPAGGFISAVVEDPNPHLGGNLISNGFTLTSLPSTNLIIAPTVNLQVDAPLQLKQESTPLSSILGYTTITANAPAGGDTGVYVTNSSHIGQELITERRAIVYALIF